MHEIHTGRSPQYLAHSVQLIVECSRRPGLMSADTADYIKLFIRTKFRENCISHPGPAAEITYLTLSLPVTPTDWKIFLKLIYSDSRFNIF